jgi:hypothetical protein
VQRISYPVPLLALYPFVPKLVRPPIEGGLESLFTKQVIMVNYRHREQINFLKDMLVKFLEGTD